MKEIEKELLDRQIAESRGSGIVNCLVEFWMNLWPKKKNTICIESKKVSLQIFSSNRLFLLIFLRDLTEIWHVFFGRVLCFTNFQQFSVKSKFKIYNAAIACIDLTEIYWFETLCDFTEKIGFQIFQKFKHSITQTVPHMI